MFKDFYFKHIHANYGMRNFVVLNFIDRGNNTNLSAFFNKDSNLDIPG